MTREKRVQKEARIRRNARRMKSSLTGKRMSDRSERVIEQGYRLGVLDGEEALELLKVI